MHLKKLFLPLIALASCSLIYCVLYTLSFYKTPSVGKAQVVRLSVNGKDMFCAPKEDNGLADKTVSLICGESMRYFAEGVRILRHPGQSERLSDMIARGHVTTLNKSRYEYDGDVTKSWFTQDPNGYVHMFDESQPMDFHCDVCAVVSASGQLLGTQAGDEIDSATCVIRMNIAPTKGYEADVGTRTTLRIAGFINLQYDTFQANKLFERDGLPEKLLIWSSNTPVIRSLVKGVSKKLVKTYSELDMYVTTEEEIRFHDTIFEKETGKNRDKTGSWLSTGWFALVFALKRCNHVKAYGFVEADHCDKITYKQDKPFHYYSMDNRYECMFYRQHETGMREGHRFFTEKYIFKKWARYFNLTFHYPEWDIWKLDHKTPFLDKPPSLHLPLGGARRKHRFRKF